MIVKELLISYLKEAVNKLLKDECSPTEEEAIEIMSAIMHIRVNKTQAAEFLGISTRTFDRKIESGDLPCGRKDRGSKSLYWFKDELINYKNE